MRLEDITPEWIRRAVARFGCHDLAPCRSVFVEPIPNDRAQVHRLRLQYASGPGDRPASLILKTPVGPARADGIHDAHDTGAREAYFFRRLAASSDLRTPRCYAVDVDPVSKASVLLLEDLATLGLRHGDRFTGIRQGDAELALSRLAAFHARDWNGRRHGALQGLLALTAHVSTAGDNAVQSYYREAWPSVEASGLYEISPEVAGVGRALLADPNRARRRLAHQPQTILHSDFHVENMFFEDAEQPDVVLIDWEDLAVGNGLVDVAWLITTSVNTRDVSWEDDLVWVYYEALTTAGVSPYSWEECRNDYRWAIETVFVQGVLNSALDATTPTEELNVERELGNRYMLACQRSRLWALS